LHNRFQISENRFQISENRFQISEEQLKMRTKIVCFIIWKMLFERLIELDHPHLAQLDREIAGFLRASMS
jgi:hypothetical protein